MEHPSLEQLRQFVTFVEFGDEQLSLIADQVFVEQVGPGKRLFDLGDTTDVAYFLVEGSVLLEAADGGSKTFDHQSPSARSPIAQLLPRRYRVTTQSPARILRVDNNLLKSFAPMLDKMSDTIDLDSTTAHGMEVSYSTPTEAAFESEISYHLYKDLAEDKLELPSLPDVAVRVSKAINDQVSDAHQIAAIVQTDMAIAAKLVKAANSAMYGGRNPVETCAAAVVRLGTELTHKLVLTFAVKELFQSDAKLLKKRMKELWEHSTRVSSIAYVLAFKLRRFDPEHALLAGLVHDIGSVAILNYARNFPEAQSDKMVLDTAIAKLHAQIGSMILRKWGFAENLAEVALNSENWQYNPAGNPTYTDIIIIAQLHAYIGTKRMPELPMIDQVPSFERLKLGKLTPRMSLQILDEAAEQIAEARTLLNL